MTRRVMLALLAILSTATPLFAKRRAVTPGAPAHCITGRITDGAYAVLLATDATHVYWIDDAGVLFRVPRLGGEADELAVFDEWLPLSMAVDAANVYVGALPIDAIFRPVPGMILAVPKSGGVMATLISGVLTPFDVEVDATHIYWAASGTFDLQEETIAPDGRIERALKNGTGRQTLAGSLSAPADVLLEGDVVWFGETGLAEGDPTVGLYNVAKNGGPVRTVNTTIASGALALSGNSVIVYGGSNDAENALFAILKDGSAVRTLRNDAAITGGLRTADGRVYFVREGDAGNELWWIPATGGTAVRVRDDLYYDNDYEIDGCVAIIATTEGELLRVTR